MSKKNVGAALLGIVAILLVLAAITILPLSASKANDIGYVSTCPFAPWSTLMLALAAGVVWVVRDYILTRA